MAETDYYQLLGVDRGADAAAIKSAYRQLAMECHPDRHGGCTDKEATFKAISEAYDVLKDPQKRAAYDRFGHAAFQNGGGGGGGLAAAGRASTASPTSSRRSSASSWTRAAQRASAARGSDLRYDLEMTLEEAFAGVEKTISIQALARCDSCDASGSKGHAAARTCHDVRRRGQGPRAAGLLRRRARLPDVHGIGRDDRRSRALRAAAKGARSRRASSASTFPPGSTKARASASRAKARRGCAAQPAATFICSSI